MSRSDASRSDASRIESWVRILGVDPGLRTMGWGVIEVFGSEVRYCADGSVSSVRGESLSDSLHRIREALVEVRSSWCPVESAAECVFAGRDPRAALRLGESRGAALSALWGLPLAEYSPSAIKKSVVGRGGADKSQIRFMVERLLLCRPLDEHSADALATALTHSRMRVLSSRLSSAGGG